MNSKNILITGAAGTIGSQLYRPLSRKHKIIATDINKDTITKNNNILPLNLNVCKDSEIDQLLGEYPYIDTLIHCAYPKTSHYGKEWIKINPKALKEELDAQLVSTFRVSQAAYQHFTDRKIKGQIILFGSIYGLMNPRFDLYKDLNFTMPVEYAMIKAAVHHLVKYMAAYAIKNKQPILVQGIAPGGVETEQPDAFKRRYQRNTLGSGLLGNNEIVNCCEFLLSPSGQALHGQILTLDYGFSLH